MITTLRKFDMLLKNSLSFYVELFATSLLLFYPSISFPIHLIKMPTLHFNLDISDIPFLFHTALTRTFPVTTIRVKRKRIICF